MEAKNATIKLKAIFNVLCNKSIKANSNSAVVHYANGLVAPDAYTVVVPDKHKDSDAHSGNSVDFVTGDTGLSTHVVSDAKSNDVVMVKSPEKLQKRKKVKEVELLFQEIRDLSCIIIFFLKKATKDVLRF